MIKVVGIRFQRAGKIYYFDPLDYDLETAMHVIVETARGVEMGTVLIPPKEVDDDKVVQPLKPVIRIATDDDEKVIEKNKEKEAEAYVICKEKIAKHGLDMKLVAADELISVSWSRIWLRCSAPVSNCGRLVCAMRQRCLAVSESVGGNCAADLI